MTSHTPAPPAVRLGVDYGSSNTVAVLATADGRTRTLLFDGVPLLPSAVYASPEGRLLVGRDAARAARLDPSRYEPSPKRRVEDGDVLLGDAAHPVADLIAAVLRRVADEATRVAGRPPDQVTLTCPVTWGEHRRAHLVAAARTAGLGTPELLPEPVAAARYFAAHLGAPAPSPAVVYDLGAGTFDVTVIRTGTDLEILAGDGLADLGGADFDAFVVAQLAAAVAERCPQQWHRLTNPATAEDRRASAELWQEAQAAKETLSRHPTASVMVPLTGEVVHVTREAFEEAAAAAIATTTRLTLRTLTAAGLTAGDVRAVYLVGGATRVPAVAGALHRALGVAPTVVEQPETIVAEGAVTLPSSAPPAPPALPASLGSPVAVGAVVGFAVDAEAPGSLFTTTSAGRGTDSGTGRRVALVAGALAVLALIAWLGVIALTGGPGSGTTGQTANRATGTPRRSEGSTPGPAANVDGPAPVRVTSPAPGPSVSPVGVPCPDVARSRAHAATMTQVRRFETASAVALICADETGGLWYHGARRSDDASITLPAQREAGDYVAYDDPARGRVRVEYRVNGLRLIRRTPTKVELDEAVTYSE